MEKIKNIILGVAIILSAFALMTFLLSARAKQMQRYEQIHNCRYDYNDLCYTREQKPWLFND